MHKTLNRTIAAGVLLALAGAAQAATKSDSFQVSALVEKNCVISAADMDFGTFDGTNDRTATSDISVSCTDGTTYDVDLSTGSSGDYTQRTLQFGADVLNYNLYTDGTFGTIWGDNSPGTGRPGTGTGGGMAVTQTLTVHGELLAADNTHAFGAGTYVDNVVATITY
jgi:spore coat protein U-like protein